MAEQLQHAREKHSGGRGDSHRDAGVEDGASTRRSIALIHVCMRRRGTSPAARALDERSYPCTTHMSPFTPCAIAASPAIVRIVVMLPVHVRTGQ